MRWYQLNLVVKWFSISATIALGLFPIIVELLHASGFQAKQFFLPLIGAILYAATWLGVKLRSPEICTKKRSEAIMFMREAHISSLSQFPYTNQLSEKQILTYLGEKSQIFHPYSTGIMKAREECIATYCDIEYSVSNSSDPLYRWILTILSVLAIFLLNWIHIYRLVRIFAVYFGITHVL